MQNKIKQIRVRIDSLSQIVKSMQPSHPFGILKFDNRISPDDVQRFIERWKEIKWDSPTVVAVNDDVEFQPIPHITNLDKCYDSLMLAKCWNGKLLGELGEESPYKNDGKRKTVEDIEDATDKSLPIELKVQINETKPIGSSTRDMNYIEKIDWLREEIKSILKDIPSVRDIIKETQKPHPVDNIYLFQCLVIQHLSEARFHLGFELEKIKQIEERK